MQLNLIPTGDNAAKDGHTPIVQFFVNVGILADKSGRQQAVILFGMLFTLVIWVITLMNLMVAVVFYLVFLFHHIPSSDRGLTGYCRRKINQSMENIVRTKVEKALRKENALRAREEAQEGEDATKRQPTLPNLDATFDEKPSLLSRQTTLATLPEFSSRPGTAAGSGVTSPSDLEMQPTLPDLDSDFRPGPLARVDTHASSASWASHGSNAPLMGDAGGMGYGPPGRMQSPGAMSPAGSYNSRSASNRSYHGYSQSTQRSYTPGIGQRPSVSQSGRSTLGTYQMEPIPRTSTPMSGRQTPGVDPSPVESYFTPTEQHNPYFSPTSEHPAQSSAATLPRSITPGGASIRSHTPRAPSSTRSITPATPSYSRPYTPGQPPLPRLQTNASSSSQAYQSYSANSQSPAQSSFTPHAPYRSFTQRPNISAASPDHYSQHNSQSPPPSGYAQLPSGHPPPTQRPGTAPPTKPQNTPVADGVMEDIMNGY